MPVWACGDRKVPGANPGEGILMTKTQIRRMRKSDFAVVQKLFAGSKKAARLTKHSFARIVSSTYNANFVAKKSNQIVGVIFGVCDGGDVGYLYKLQVNPAFVKQGIGSALVNRALASWKKYKLRLVFGRVSKTNTPSKKLFEKNGFTMLKSNYRVMDYGI